MKTAESNCFRLHTAVIAFCCLLLPVPAVKAGGDYSATIAAADVRLADGYFMLSSSISYVLSPVAKEAITKGVPLSWVLHLRIKKQGWLWDKTLYSLDIPWVIQYQALLNQYSVNNLHDQHKESFATLSSALDYMGTLRNIMLPGHTLPEGDDFYLAMKVEFDREFLPVPLRPESYFNLHWFLSSDWYLWPLQN